MIPASEAQHARSRPWALSCPPPGERDEPGPASSRLYDPATEMTVEKVSRTTPLPAGRNSSHKAEEYIDAYLEAARLWERKKEPIFRGALGKTKQLSAKRMTRHAALKMIQRRAKFPSQQGERNSPGQHLLFWYES